MCRLLGYTEQELQQKTHLDVIHLEDLEGAAVARALAISGKAKPRLAERRYVHRDGSTIWVQGDQFRFVEVSGVDQELDTDIVIGKTRWEIPGLGALPDKAWERNPSNLYPRITCTL